MSQVRIVLGRTVQLPPRPTLKSLCAQTLYTIVVAVCGALSTVFPLMLALRTPDHIGGDTPCGLNAQQLAGIQAAMLSRNQSCHFNMTVEEALAMG